MATITEYAGRITDWLENRQLKRKGKKKAITVTFEVDDDVYSVPGLGLTNVFNPEIPKGLEITPTIHRGIELRPQPVTLTHVVGVSCGHGGGGHWSCGGQ